MLNSDAPPELTTAHLIFLKAALKIRPRAYYRDGVGRQGRALRSLRDGLKQPVWAWL